MQIHWAGLTDLHPDIRVAIEARLERLGSRHGDLIDVRIAADRTGHHRRGGRVVRISCFARGRQLVAVRERAELGLALNEALDDFERELHELHRRRREKRNERSDLGRRHEPRPEHRTEPA